MFQLQDDYRLASKLGARNTAIGRLDGFQVPLLESRTIFLTAIFIGAYFAICWFIIILLVTSVYILNNENDIIAVEVTYVSMIVIPLTVIFFWVPHSIWDTIDVWLIRDEMVYQFLFIEASCWCNSVIVACLPFADVATVLQIRVSMESVTFLTTIVCVCVLIDCMIMHGFSKYSFIVFFFFCNRCSIQPLFLFLFD